MADFNSHFKNLSGGYLFQDIAKKVALFREKQNGEIYDLGIGDISEPLSPFIMEELSKASLELKDEAGIRGYGPSQGYLFLREPISQCDYKGLDISPDEIFISSGIKDAISTFQELFALKSKIGLMDPTYPVYLDSNIMAGRSSNLHFLPCREENGFEPQPPKETLDLIYLCSPNNPTGIAFSKENLKLWVEYAKENRSLILFDGAYEAFISSPFPRSIYEIAGAKETAIEFRSYSKSAGFTALRCGYVVVPKEIKSGNILLKDLWKRRCDAKYGGVPYPVQRAAEAVYTEKGKTFVKEKVRSYKERSLSLKQRLIESGFKVSGGENSPYLWCRHPSIASSWQLFDLLLERAKVVCVPGSGFGPSGEGYVRFSALQREESVKKAVDGIRKLNL